MPFRPLTTVSWHTNLGGLPPPFPWLSLSPSNKESEFLSSEHWVHHAYFLLHGDTIQIFSPRTNRRLFSFNSIHSLYTYIPENDSYVGFKGTSNCVAGIFTLRSSPLINQRFSFQKFHNVYFNAFGHRSFVFHLRNFSLCCL